MERDCQSQLVHDVPTESKSFSQRYYAVEFSLEGLQLPYQFKIWNLPAEPCVLVKEGSELLSRLRVGDKLNMKYYSDEKVEGVVCRLTEIRYITRNEDGPFRGHYLVGLEIMGTQQGH